MSGNAFSISACENTQQIRPVEKAGIEEVWGHAPGFESECAKLEDGGCETGLQECLFVRCEGLGFRC